ncbi:hypothetical protein DXT76_01035 [Halobacillus trueperi]|uniref:Uncharacterized protein n=1 Tax=Halobacillus trueperi TaxID=156205 RepID=A0A3D8VT48_9BACI|nr:hypothetical protein [Halobacillus trueperi]RDY72556.1 hypothetical protein DXT76_01035 [Halobacillus trueperi]
MRIAIEDIPELLDYAREIGVHEREVFDMVTYPYEVFRLIEREQELQRKLKKAFTKRRRIKLHNELKIVQALLESYK